MKSRLSPNPFYKILPPNEHGTDYYIGDLHGMYDLLMFLLKAVNFDTTKDRLISVGDLIDRGPKSFECLMLLYEPWFFSVLSNHDEMMMHAYHENADWHNHNVSGSWFHNGGAWAQYDLAAFFRNELIEERHYQMCEIGVNVLPTIPLILHVEQKDGSVIHVMHAELPKGEVVNYEKLTDEVNLNKIFNKSIDTRYSIIGLMWDRFRFGPFYKVNPFGDQVDRIKAEIRRDLQGIGRSEHLFISGHTVCQQPTRIGNFLNLDTGASLIRPPYGLSCYNSSNASFCKAVTNADGSFSLETDVKMFELDITEQ